MGLLRLAEDIPIHARNLIVLANHDFSEDNKILRMRRIVFPKGFVVHDVMVHLLFRKVFRKGHFPSIITTFEDWVCTVWRMQDPYLPSVYS